MDSEIAHLESLLDLFRKIDALTRSAVGLREQVDEQMLAARKREDDIGRAIPSPNVVGISSSLPADRRQRVKTKAKRGQGDKGDR